jgi:hypothetical protein
MFVFISYSRRDTARAEAFAKAFAAEGVDAFWDRAIPAGVHWNDYLARKLGEADIVLVLWSETSVASPYVKEEADVGKRQGKLVPVAIDPVEPPFGFSLLQATDFTTWDETTTSEPWVALRRALARTREALAAGVGGQEAAFTLPARQAPGEPVSTVSKATSREANVGKDKMTSGKAKPGEAMMTLEHATDGKSMEAMAPKAMEAAATTDHAAMTPKAMAPRPTGLDPAEAATDPVVGWIVIVRGPGRGRSRPIGLGFNPIGRSGSNRITLDFGDTGISREEHVAIVYEPRARNFVAVLGRAQNIVRVNDEALLAPTPLANGDTMMLGDTELRLVTLCGPDFAW